MKGLLAGQSLIVALILLATAAPGRAHPWRKSIHDHRYQTIQETLVEILENAAENQIETNELDEMGIDADDAAAYSARHDYDEVDQQASRGHSRNVFHPASYQFHHQEVCETKKTWKILNETKDVDGNWVEILSTNTDKQYVYIYECASPCTACKKVTSRSMCKMRYTYVKMYHRRKSPPFEEKWGFVEVPSHCACELLPENIRDVECDY